MKIFHSTKPEFNTLTFRFESAILADLNIAKILSIFYYFIYRTVDSNTKLYCLVQIFPLEKYFYKPINLTTIVTSANKETVVSKLLSIIANSELDPSTEIAKVTIRYKIKR